MLQKRTSNKFISKEDYVDRNLLLMKYSIISSYWDYGSLQLLNKYFIMNLKYIKYCKDILIYQWENIRNLIHR